MFPESTLFYEKILFGTGTALLLAWCVICLIRLYRRQHMKWITPLVLLLPAGMIGIPEWQRQVFFERFDRLELCVWEAEKHPEDPRVLYELQVALEGVAQRPVRGAERYLVLAKANYYLREWAAADQYLHFIFIQSPMHQDAWDLRHQISRQKELLKEQISVRVAEAKP
jgi:hypothetical protein